MLFASREIEKAMKKQPERIIARIREFNGGRYGRTGESIAIIEPEYFKNGEVKHSIFRRIETLETLKKGYSYAGASHNEQIIEILEVVENEEERIEK